MWNQGATAKTYPPVRRLPSGARNTAAFKKEGDGGGGVLGFGGAKKPVHAGSAMEGVVTPGDYLGKDEAEAPGGGFAPVFVRWSAPPESWRQVRECPRARSPHTHTHARAHFCTCTAALATACDNAAEDWFGS